MLYYEFETGNEIYKLRLNTRNVISLERMLGKNPLSIFGAGDTIPTVTEMVNVFFCALQQLNHGISIDKAYDLFDSWISEGHNATEFVNIIIEIYKVSGLIAGDKEKN